MVNRQKVSLWCIVSVLETPEQTNTAHVLVVCTHSSSHNWCMNMLEQKYMRFIAIFVLLVKVMKNFITALQRWVCISITVKLKASRKPTADYMCPGMKPFLVSLISLMWICLLYTSDAADE